MEKIIFYGAGKIGRATAAFFSSLGLKDNIAFFCDQNASEIKTLDGIMVISYSKAKLLHLPFLISVGKENRQGIEELLKKDKQKYYYDAADWNRESGMLDAVEFNRQYVAFYHKDSMNQYFKDAEIADSLAVFWNTESPFYMRFKQLDLENVIELACGRGRHVPEYINSAEHITLVDILQKNIDICKQRFESESKIDYYCNNGSDLSELTDNTYTSLFTYDFMVHFEMMDIYKYLFIGNKTSSKKRWACVISSFEYAR